MRARPWLIACYLALSTTLADAAGTVALSQGFGPDQYRTTDLSGGIDLFELPLQLNAEHYVARIDGHEEVNQTTAGVLWSPHALVSAEISRTHLKETLFNLNGTLYGLHLNTERLWQGKQVMRVNLEYGDYEYDIHARPSVQAALSRFIPEQKRYSLGLEQELGMLLSVYARHDEYEYTEDPLTLARLLLRRARNPASPVFVLISFPERTDTLGFSWAATEKLEMDISHMKTSTVVDQVLESTQIATSYSFTDRFSLSANIARTRTGAINTARRGTVIDSEKGTYLELSAAFRF